MSLKTFHLVFIATAILLAFLFTAWAGVAYYHSHDPLHLIFGLMGLVAGVALIYYGSYVWRKFKEVDASSEMDLL